jgi:hypothetical protein
MGDKIYERQFTVEQGNELVIPTGMGARCFALDFPHEAKITKLVVQQVGGAVRAFAVDLFNRPVCQQGSLSSQSLNMAISPAMCKVIPTQVQDAGGQSLELFNPDGFTFRNMEGNQTNPVRKIYLQIDPDTAEGDTAWEVAIGCKIAGAR